MTMAGVSQRAVIAMLGHRDPRMTVWYPHLSSEHLTRALHPDRGAAIVIASAAAEDRNALGSRGSARVLRD